jgi:transposase
LNKRAILRLNVSLNQQKNKEDCVHNYKGKTVYLGIDVHKKSYMVSAICDGKLEKRDRLEAKPKGLVDYCSKFFSGAAIESAYEAGFCGFYLHRFLEKHHFKNHVIHAAGMEIAVGNKVKTDKRDSLKLAVQLSVGRLKGIHVPSEERENYRKLTRLRETFLRHRTRFGCQIKSVLLQHGLIRPDDDRRVSKKWLKNILEEEMSFELKFTLESLSQMWLILTDKMSVIDEELKKQSVEDESIEKVYRSAPGIGPVAARTLANELGDMFQFKNERQLFSYLGLTPSEYSSGEHIRHGHISRQGKARLRYILVQAAWVAIRHDNELKEDYERISKTRGGKKAIVGVARRLIGRIRSCFRQGVLYQKAYRKQDMDDFESASVSK